YQVRENSKVSRPPQLRLPPACGIKYRKRPACHPRDLFRLGLVLRFCINGKLKMLGLREIEGRCGKFQVFPNDVRAVGDTHRVCIEDSSRRLSKARLVKSPPARRSRE